jgi:hypothetical protein
MRSTRRTALVAAGLLLAAVPAAAQRSTPPSFDAPRPSRFTVGLDGVVMDPRGTFGRNVSNVGFGVGGHALFRLDPRGILAVRADFAGAQYGSERAQLPSSPYFGGRIGLEVATRNSLSWVGIGPELSLPLGRLRPYVNGSIAYARFSTVSDLEGDGYDAFGNFQSNRRLASSQNQADGTSARAVGAGIYIPVGPQRWLTDAHVGVRYFDGAQAEYLREGSITDTGDGGITFTPLRSRTPFVAYQLGVSVAIPRSGRR